MIFDVIYNKLVRLSNKKYTVIEVGTTPRTRLEPRFRESVSEQRGGVGVGVHNVPGIGHIENDGNTEEGVRTYLKQPTQHPWHIGVTPVLE